MFHSLAEVAAEVDAAGPPRWLFKGIVVEGDYGILSAEYKAGKTWAILDAAISCAAGLPWLGQFECEASGPVIVFFGEGSKRKMVRRARAVGKSKGIAEADTDRLPIVPCFTAPQLNDLQILHEVRKAVEQYRPSLIIIDPLYLAAGDKAKSSDLNSMGAMLYRVQRIAQEFDASLLITHHWNKTGQGDGHDRSSGVGPAEWGRFLISVGVQGGERTDPNTKESTVRLKWQFKGDEIAVPAMTLIRRVRADDPDDLSSPMQYSIEQAANEPEDGTAELTPSERKLLEAMIAAGGRPETVAQLVDRIAEKHGHGLRRETCSRGLNRLAELNLADQIPPEGVGKAAQWFALEEIPGQAA
ncbi:AAA family ATPase [Streptomyces sp. DG2A-72]|uniref:AAA family ATPase n=1 Tax=Streptomyces sp. DG2A-72 TaxID=3051386 RepID=UPI00265BB993|nr:AAA family ATPase [Streptomyces sp. DG2A-72]MDO0937403.1 AAA family ATPase [Streptomyces sp. DG2A-72]